MVIAILGRLAAGLLNRQVPRLRPLLRVRFQLPFRYACKGSVFRARLRQTPGMNICHAAALALVGWYLMVPPHVGENGHPDAGVPLA